jgi:hypothetical protein
MGSLAKDAAVDDDGKARCKPEADCDLEEVECSGASYIAVSLCVGLAMLANI